MPFLSDVIPGRSDSRSRPLPSIGRARERTAGISLRTRPIELAEGWRRRMVRFYPRLPRMLRRTINPFAWRPAELYVAQATSGAQVDVPIEDGLRDPVIRRAERARPVPSVLAGIPR